MTTQLKSICPVCSKNCENTQENIVGKLKITTYSCGHVRSKKIPQTDEIIKALRNIKSIDNRTPYNYQIDGAGFAIKSGYRCLIADEMGVGKTWQSFLAAKADEENNCPILIICKPGLKIQMQKELYRLLQWPSQIIDNEKSFIIPNLKAYIIGYDTLAYSVFVNKKGKVIKRGIENLDDFVGRISPRLIILDECQQIKNTGAERTKAVRSVAKKIDRVIALSGTPITNNGSEYFPILNILRPDKVNNKEHFIMRWFDTYFNGYAQKVGGIKNIPAWQDFTKDFIIRRTRAEVLPDLPEITRNYRFEELGAKTQELYNQIFTQFQDAYLYGDKSNKLSYESNILGYLNKMRHVTGIAKIPGVVDFAEEFLTETDRKIVIFNHHIDIAKEVVERIEGKGFGKNLVYAPSPVDNNLVDLFTNNPEKRILIGSTLALGEGFNLQCASDCIIMEREWTPAKEEQAEGRFPRPGQKESKITATYFVAVGTIDEFFADLVEQKRSYVASTLDGKEIQWNEASLIKELAEILATKGAKKWSF